MSDIDPTYEITSVHLTDQDVKQRTLSLEKEKLDIELQKLAIERAKLQWTALAGIVPLLAAHEIQTC